jgi:hypothetical protein
MPVRLALFCRVMCHVSVSLSAPIRLVSDSPTDCNVCACRHARAGSGVRRGRCLVRALPHLRARRGARLLTGVRGCSERAQGERTGTRDLTRSLSLMSAVVYPALVPRVPAAVCAWLRHAVSSWHVDGISISVRTTAACRSWCSCNALLTASRRRSRRRRARRLAGPSRTRSTWRGTSRRAAPRSCRPTSTGRASSLCRRVVAATGACVARRGSTVTCVRATG